jgi:glycosyltransferase involved in cell wall biosynthesis
MADVHVLPSINRAEAFGLVALEAAGSGIPSIASNLPGVRTVVRDKETGLLVQPGDAWDLCRALQTLFRDAGFRLRLGEAARARAVSLYNWEKLVDRLEKVYEEVADGRQ